jgi:hypothetical protein
MEEFDQWRCIKEKSSASKFVYPWGEKSNKRGDTSHTLWCFKSEKTVSRQREQSSTKNTEQLRCTAFIKVYISKFE